MPLATRTRLGPYEVLAPIGAGGMGEVYRAKDARLGRDVAVKILPSVFSNDPERVRRFDQEGRAAAALNHPNIIAIYDVGSQDGMFYVVTELLEGETLRERLAGAALPVRKAIDYGVQIARGLAAAHAKGITHRDLKPENLFLTKDGLVKILDFGLAKQNTEKPIGLSPTDLPTEAMETDPGKVLGTAGYMSPEQVRGQVADARSDLFSLGIVLYEMVAGKRAFTGDSAVEVMNAILKQEPPELDAALPPSLDRVIHRCLEKKPEERFQSALDLAFALESISGSSERKAQPLQEAQRRHHIRTIALAVAGVCVLAAGFVAGRWTSRTPIPEFHRLTFRQGSIGAARVSTDGKTVIYAAAWDGDPSRIYLASLGNPEARDLDLPAESRLLSVSPKGDVAFLAGPFGIDGSGTLARNSVSGGQTRELLEGVLLADWAPDGMALAVVRSGNGQFRLEYPPGKVLFQSEYAPFSIRFSPNGDRIGFSAYSSGSRISLFVVDRSGKLQDLGTVSGQTSTVDASPLSWTRDGKEIWFRSFDTNEEGTVYGMTLTGRRRVVARFPGRVTLYDIAGDGSMLLSTDNVRTGILALAPGESVERDVSSLESSTLQGISDDGRLILANIPGESGGPKGSIYLRRTDGSAGIRLGDGVAQALSPDGKWVNGYSSKVVATRKYMLMPTGPGEQVDVEIPELVDGAIAGWLAGEQNYLVQGVRAGAGHRPWQFFARDSRGGQVRAVSPEGMPDYPPLISPDRQRFLTLGPDQAWHVYPILGGEPKIVTGLSRHDTPINWRADNRTLYFSTHRDQNKTLPVSLLDIDTGKRTPWKEIRPAIPVDEVDNLRITPDGRGYAYNFTYARSDLFWVRGIK